MKFIISLSIFVLSSVVMPVFGAQISTKEQTFSLENKENNQPDQAIKFASRAIFERRPVERKSVENAVSSKSAKPDTIVFFLTAPHDQDDRGDTDYVKSVMRALKDLKTVFEVDYIRGSTQLDARDLYDVDRLNDNNSMKNMPEYQIDESEIRIQAIENIIRYIKGFCHSKKILHLQLRSPETGCMLQVEDLVRLKEVVSKLVITCHEWEHYRHSEKARKNQIKELSYIKEADHVIFLNKIDELGAIGASKKGHLLSETEKCEKFEGLDNRCCLSNVSATVPTQLVFSAESFLGRRPNVLIFGLIRPAKGFEEVLNLATAIAQLTDNSPIKDARVIIAGKPHDYQLVRTIIMAKYGGTSDFMNNMNTHIETKSAQFHSESNKEPLRDKTNNYRDSNQPKTCDQLKRKIKLKIMLEYVMANSTNKPEALPIDIHFEITSQKLDELSQQCKFCVKLEDKCFANNSSSIINAMHRSMIVFTRRGDLTSSDFLSKGKYEKALFLLEPDNSNVKSELNKRDFKLERDNRDVKLIIETMTSLQNTDDECLTILKKLEECISELFCDRKIGNDHITIYEDLLKK